MPEQTLVRYILSEISSLYNYFNFVVEPAVGPIPRRGWDYVTLAEVPRENLGLRAGQPGDIDIIIVPSLDGTPQFDRTMAIEVKRLALRGPKWTKNVDRYGGTQAIGLARAGFPFVGILHLIVSKPGPPEHFREMHEARIIDDFGRCELLGPTLVDMTGVMAAERQFARLERQPIPKFIGLNSVALTHIPKVNGKIIYGETEPCYRNASRNPHTNKVILHNIEVLLDSCRPLVRMRPADVRKYTK